MGADMFHGQLIAGDVLTGGLFQIGDQIRQEQVLQLAAVPADQMAVRRGIAVVAVGLSRDCQPADLPICCQLVQIAVDRTHGNVGHLLPCQEKDLLGGHVIVDMGEYVVDEGLLFGHLFTTFRKQELFLVLLYHIILKSQEENENNS